VGQWFNTVKLSNVVPVWQGGPNMGFGDAGKDAQSWRAVLIDGAC
jgi:hypothetical protein